MNFLTALIVFLSVIISSFNVTAKIFSNNFHSNLYVILMRSRQRLQFFGIINLEK